MKTDTIDILLLEYLWRKPYYDLSIFSRPEFLQGENFPYHELDMKELVERLMRFIRHGLLRFNYDQNFSSMGYIFLTSQSLETYLCDHKDDYEPERKKPIDQEEEIIHVRLSRKGGQVWAEGVQADWSRYFVFHSGWTDRLVMLESRDKTTIKSLLKLYEERLAVDFHKRPTLNILRPWNPYRVYWLEFEEGFYLRFFSTGRSVDFRYTWPWRLVWRRDEHDRPTLVPIESIIF